MKPATAQRRLRKGPIFAVLLVVLLIGSVLFFSNLGGNVVSAAEKQKVAQPKVVSRRPADPQVENKRPTAVIRTTSLPAGKGTISSKDPNIVCKDKKYGEVETEVNRLLSFRIDHDPSKTNINEYKPEELSDTPAIEGGLYTDRQCLDMPHEGEKYIPFAEYLDCLSTRLHVDYKNQKELELTDDEKLKSFPYMMSMATVEIGDIKTVMCNINVPIQRMLYVINSDVPSIANFFHDVEKAFKFTKRLRVHWPGYNMGYAGAVNFGMRDAMRYSFDEVPFFMIMNNDVRFTPNTLPGGVPQFWKAIKHDKEMLESLRAEVAAEPSEYTPENRRHPLLRSSDNSTLLVTSMSLPDRIRYMPYTERRNIFSKYYGALYTSKFADTAAFGMSRLAMETVGFMDENFYPAYYEDVDWAYRQLRTGFDHYLLKEVPYQNHYVNALLKMGQRYYVRPSTATEAERFAGHLTNVLKPVPSTRRVIMKYGYGHNHEQRDGPYEQCHELPVDVWVMDVPRRKAIMKALKLSRDFYNSKSRTSTEAVQSTRHILNWLPKDEREAIVRGIAGRPLTDVIPEAFDGDKLTRHEK